MSKYMFIDGIRVEFDQEPNILTLVRKAGIELPTFCYYSDLSIYGACRMCMVEDERGGMVAACSTPPKQGMSIRTHTPKLYKHRRMILELLLSAHCRDCTLCEKSGKCSLQKLARRFGLRDIRFRPLEEQKPLDNSSRAIVRDPSKCILCGDCVRMCNETQHVGAIDFAHRGARMTVSTAFERPLAETNCVDCGQCAAVCPTGAITVKSSADGVWSAIHDPGVRTVVQIAPAVRVALGEEFRLGAGVDVMGRIIAALHRMGFDQVFDTAVGADLTIMEEAGELKKRLEEGEKEYPLFTSCCPAWVRYAETAHPELVPHLSTCKSPMEMFGAVLREHYRLEDERDGKKTVSVAIMPCTAKKAEAAREEYIRDGRPDVDYVLTTTELVQMIEEAGIEFDELDIEAPDMPFFLSSGAGVIFGATGGVTEAALRRLSEDKSPRALREFEYAGVRGMQGVKTCEVPYGERTLRIAVVSGLGNADQLIERIEAGEEHFDFVEVMACPGGCVAGAGQPFGHRGQVDLRSQGLYKADKASVMKRSEENPLIRSLYDDILKNRVHQMLHVHRGQN
ncbi:NADH-dependent [FeFe] hydrogenase, group A6 [Pseudoflavonifractor gallinarum]|uniref:[FeFe] hydrogenase, group A n=1 Tax=Eubacteriales TaxID=186802 RepID=UPI001899656E|nr:MULTISPECIES: [FeFe] hydrogenase, group A [Eubacteriales]MBT9685378.1 4Fe-4S dicluster domain-containing protein [Pseudoflavonifractor sp. MCC625]